MRLARFLRDRSGATAVEFAFTAPVFFMLVGGLIEVGILFFTQLALQHGAEAGARCGSIDTHNCATTSQIQAYAAAESFGLSVPASTFTVTSPQCGTQVVATNTVPMIFYFGRSSLTLTAQACFPK
jgi:Flp pilus assembly protein TadG